MEKKLEIHFQEHIFMSLDQLHMAQHLTPAHYIDVIMSTMAIFENGNVLIRGTVFEKICSKYCKQHMHGRRFHGAQ